MGPPGSWERQLCLRDTNIFAYGRVWGKNKEDFPKQFSERSKRVWDRFFRCLNFDFNEKRNRGAVAARGVSRRAPERRAPQGGVGRILC